MLHIALAFFLGDGWVQCLPVLSAAWLRPPLLLAVLLLLMVYWLPRSWQRRWLQCVIAFAVGVIWAAGFASWRLSQDLSPALEGQDVLITGYISSLPERAPQGMRFRFTVDPPLADRPLQPPGLLRSDVAEGSTALDQHPALLQQPTALPALIELTWYSPPANLHAAQRWLLQVRLRRRHGFANPGGQDREQQLLREGIGAVGYVRDSADNRLHGLAAGHWVLKLRATISGRLNSALPHAPMQGVMRGLAVGDQQAISAAGWQIFARTGTSHLMAISGSHIGMIGALFAWLGGALVRWPGMQRWQITRPMVRAVSGMSATLAYCLLAGMSLPTLRTLLMMSVYFLAQLWWRQVGMWSNFGLALLLVLLIDPMAPLAIGAWLSFGAVAILLLACTGQVGEGPWWRVWLQSQGVVSVALVPLLLAGFGALPLWSPLVNLLAIPLFTVVLVPAVLLGCVLLFAWPVVGIAWLHGTGMLMNGIYAVLQWVAQQPQAVLHLSAVPLSLMVLLVCGVVLAVLPLRWPWRMGGVLAALPALLFQPTPLPVGAFQLVALDVGQGLALAIHTRHHLLLYDTGPQFQSGRDTGELVVVPYLHARGVQVVDDLMISHGDQDHAGGMQTVVDEMPVRQLTLGPSVKRPQRAPHSLAIQPCRRGQHWQWDGVEFTVLHPADDQDDSDNNTSCALHIQAPGGSALLLGDLEQRVERQLVSDGLITATDIVVAAHHGSRSSSSPPLVEAARARWVIFSTGYRNRWGFPKEEVVQRWREAGATPLTTAETGAVSLTVTPAGVESPQRWRSVHRHYWN